MSPAARPIAALLAVFATTFAACADGTTSATVCTAVAEPAVQLTLTDAQSGELVRGATVTLREGSYTETLRENDAVYVGGHERPGTYDLLVRAFGYADATRTAIVAAALPCGPDTQVLQLTLQPVAAPALVLIDDGTAMQLLPVVIGVDTPPRRLR